MSVLNNHYHNQYICIDKIMYIYFCMCVCVCLNMCVYMCIYMCVCVYKKEDNYQKGDYPAQILFNRSPMYVYVRVVWYQRCVSVCFRVLWPFSFKKDPFKQPSQQPSQKNKKARFSCASRISLMLFMRRKARASLTSHRIIRTMRIYLASHRISHMRAHMRAFNNTGLVWVKNCESVASLLVR